MKRLFLFLILFCSGIVILMLFMEEEEAVVPELLPDRPASTPEEPEALGPPRAAEPPEDAEEREPPQSAAPSSPSEQEAPPAAQASGRDMTLPIRRPVVAVDGTTQDVLAALLHVGYMANILGTNRYEAEDVSFDVFDRTPAERVVARGTASRGILYSTGGRGELAVKPEFHRHFVLMGNVRIRLIARPAATGDGKPEETLILSEHLVIDEDKITSPRSDGENGLVTIVAPGMEISGRGMTVDVAAKTLTFEHDTEVFGTDFSLPRLFPGGDQAGAGAGSGSDSPEPGGIEADQSGAGGDGDAARDDGVMIRCGGPFLFAGTADPAGETDDGRLLSSGTVSFAGGVTAERGATRLTCDNLYLRFEKDAESRLALSHLRALSSEARQTVLAAESGVIRGGTIEWTAVEAGSRCTVTGEPVIDNIVLPSVGGAAGDASYSLSADEEIVFAVLDGDETRAAALEVTLSGNARIQPAAAAAAPEKAFSVAGDEIFLAFRSEPADGAARDRLPADGERFVPECIRITGRARIMMQGRLEADEITMTLEPAKEGLHQVIHLAGGGRLQNDDFLLESAHIVIRTIPGVVTRISTDDGFRMDLSLESFSGVSGAAPAPGETTSVTATGDKVLDLWWPDDPSGSEASERRNMRINGPYLIHIGLTGGRKVVLRGDERFTMGTNLYEGRTITSLELMGSPHVAMTEQGRERMVLDSRQAYVDLDHTAKTAPAGSGPAPPGSELAPAAEPEPGAGFFTTSLVRRIQALHDVHLKYGSSKIRCDTIDWDLPADRLVADGGGGPVTLETAEGGMKLTGSRFLLRPEKEEWIILDPEASFKETINAGARRILEAVEDSDGGDGR